MQRTSLTRRFAIAAAAVATTFLSGCFGYQLGSALPSDIKTVHVPTFVNKCGEPLVENETTRAAVKEFQNDGTLRPTGAEQADAVVEVTLTGFVLEPLRYEKSNPKLANEYRLKLNGDMVFRRAASTNNILVRCKVAGETTFVLTGDLPIAKQIALPNASKDLARKIVGAVVEYW